VQLPCKAATSGRAENVDARLDLKIKCFEEAGASGATTGRGFTGGF
jgi:hypothetical protein